MKTRKNKTKNKVKNKIKTKNRKGRGVKCKKPKKNVTHYLFNQQIGKKSGIKPIFFQKPHRYNHITIQNKKNLNVTGACIRKRPKHLS